MAWPLSTNGLRLDLSEFHAGLPHDPSDLIEVHVGLVVAPGGGKDVSDLKAVLEVFGVLTGLSLFLGFPLVVGGQGRSPCGHGWTPLCGTPTPGRSSPAWSLTP